MLFCECVSVSFYSCFLFPFYPPVDLFVFGSSLNVYVGSDGCVVGEF